MTRNAWAFAVDPDLWMPLPPAERLKDGLATRWVDKALERAAYTNLATPDEVAILRARCEALLEQPRSAEAMVFFPVMEPFPVVVQMETLDHDAWTASVEQWKRDDEDTRNLEVTVLEHEHLADAERIMRVEQRGSSIHYSVGFFGKGESYGLALTADTVEPLVAGQLASAGAAVFGTFYERVIAAR